MKHVMHDRSLLLATALLLCTSSEVHAQTSWSGTWRIVGWCIDGLKVDVKEEPGVLVVTIHGNERFQTSERRVPLGPDGSRKMTYETSAFGPLELAVAPGSGKRSLKLTQQQKGFCQWEVK